MTFMVVHGFSLIEVRKLYLDELGEYYKQTVYVLEKKGEFKEGTFDKIAHPAGDAKHTVNQLRSALLGLKNPKKK